MPHDANLRLTGNQIRLVQDGLRNAFVDYNDLSRLVLYELDERLNDIVVQQATFPAQIVQLIEWAEAKGKTKNLLLAAAREVPGNARLRDARKQSSARATWTTWRRSSAATPPSSATPTPGDRP
jgi:hypothetical protein